jgi:hypothetical protein
MIMFMFTHACTIFFSASHSVFTEAASPGAYEEKNSNAHAWN